MGFSAPGFGTKSGGAVAQLAAQTLSANSGSIAFPGLSQSYRALVIMGNIHSEEAVTQDHLVVTFNGDAVDANYQIQQMLADSSAYSARHLASSGLWCTVNGNTYQTFSTVTITVPAYIGTGLIIAQILGSCSYHVEQGAGIWNGPGPVTDLAFSLSSGADFSAGSSVAIYGYQ
jgi:hypothetical protein